MINIEELKNKNQILKYFVLLLILNISATGFSQNISSITGDESELYAETKQVNQFFRRFNNEEDRFGERYYEGDEGYRDNEFRKVYLNMLFNNENTIITEDLKSQFIEDVSGDDSPVYLEFHGGSWFAEIATNFKYYGNSENLLLFLKLEKENLGSKWVMTNVYFNKFLRKFYKGDEREIEKSFLHPMSHELDFMNIHKAFKNDKYVEYYASKEYQPDYLSLLFYEIKMGNMKYVNTGQTKFHFFQIDGWYFEVSYLNRPGNNSGWLITKLYKINEEEKKELIKFYLP